MDSTQSLEDYYQKTFSQFKGKGYKYVLVSWILHEQDLGKGGKIKFIEISKYRKLDAIKFQQLITIQIECAKHFMNIHLNMNLIIEVASYVNLFSRGLSTTITIPNSPNMIDSKMKSTLGQKSLFNFESMVNSQNSDNISKIQGQENRVISLNYVQQTSNNTNTPRQSEIAEEMRLKSTHQFFTKQLALIQQQAKEILAGNSPRFRMNQTNKMNQEQETNINFKKSQDQNEQSGLFIANMVNSDNQIFAKQTSNINLEESEHLDNSQICEDQQIVSPELKYMKQRTKSKKKKILNMTPVDSFSKFKTPRQNTERENSYFFNNYSSQNIISPKSCEKINLLQDSGIYDGQEIINRNEIDNYGQQGINPSDRHNTQRPSIQLLSSRGQQEILSQRAMQNYSQIVQNENNDDRQSFQQSYNNTQSQNQINLSYNQNISHVKLNNNDYSINNNIHQIDLKNNQNLSTNNYNQNSTINRVNINRNHSDKNISYNINQQNHQLALLQGNSPNHFTQKNQTKKQNLGFPSQNSILELQEDQPTIETEQFSPEQNNNVSNNAINYQNLKLKKKNINNSLDNIGLTLIGSNNNIGSQTQINSPGRDIEQNNNYNSPTKDDNRRIKPKKITANSLSPNKKLTHVSFKYNMDSSADSPSKNSIKKQRTKKDHTYDPNKYNFDQFQFYSVDKSQEIWEESSQSEIEDNQENQNYNMKVNSLDVANEEVEIKNYTKFNSGQINMNQMNPNQHLKAAHGEVQDSSIHSSQTQTSQQRIYVMKVIKSKKQTKLFTSANFAGYLGLVLLISMTSGLYAETTKQFNFQHYSMINMPLATDLYSSYSHLIKNRNLQQLYTVNYFKMEQNYLGQLQNNLKNEQIQLYNRFKSSVNQMVLAHAEMEYVNYLYNTNIDILIYPTPKVYEYPIQVKFSILYGFMMLQGYLNNHIFPASTFDSIIGEVYSAANVLSYKQHLTEMEKLVVNATFDSFSSIDNIYNVSLSIIVMVSLFVVILIYIMNIIFIYNQENILQLFATFSPELLQKLINNLDEQLRQIFNVRQFMTQNYLQYEGQNNNIINQNKKINSNLNIPQIQIIKNSDATAHSLSRLQCNGRKTISLTSKLDKFKLSQIFICLIVICIVSTYPLANLLIKNQFKKESQTHVEELGYILSVPSHLGQCLFSLYGVMGFKIKEMKNYKENVYYNLFNDLIKENQQKLNNLYSLLELIESTNNISEKSYSSQFYPLLNSNACDVLESSKKYQGTTLIKTCRSIFDGVFEKGLIVSLKKVFNLIDQLSEIYNTSTDQNLQANIQIWDQNINSNKLSSNQSHGVVAFNEAYELIIQITEYQQEFVINQYQTIYDETCLWLVLLFIYSFLIYLLLFVFGWYKFFHSQLNKIHKTRNLLSIFQISTLLENPYVMSYFKQVISYSNEFSSSHHKSSN